MVAQRAKARQREDQGLGVPNEENDGQLHARWRQGDREAGAKLIERHYAAVARFFHTKVGLHADDLIQRTFLACVEGRGAYRGDASFRAYLFGIARYVIIDFFRARGHETRIDADASVGAVIQHGAGPFTIVSAHTDRQVLIDALRRLPLEIQMTLELFYSEGLSLGEVSSVLEVPEGTVKSRLHRGRKLLEKRLTRLAGSTFSSGTHFH